MTSNVSNNAQTSVTQAIARDAVASNTVGAEVERWVASSYQIKAELGDISKALAELAAMKGELTEKRQEIELLKGHVFSASTPATFEALSLRDTRAKRLNQLVGDAGALVKDVEVRTQAIVEAQATVINGLSIDDVVKQEMSNTRSEIRSMQAEYDALAKSAGAITQEAARTGKLERAQERELQESSERMRFLRESIDTKSGQVVAAQEGLINGFSQALRQEIEQGKLDIKGWDAEVAAKFHAKSARPENPVGSSADLQDFEELASLFRSIIKKREEIQEAEAKLTALL